MGENGWTGKGKDYSRWNKEYDERKRKETVKRKEKKKERKLKGIEGEEKW